MLLSSQMPVAAASRDWSVYPVWLLGAQSGEYAKVRAVEGAIGVGRRVNIQREGSTAWLPAQVAEQPAGLDGHGFRVWVRLDDGDYR